MTLYPPNSARAREERRELLIGAVVFVAVVACVAYAIGGAP